MSSIRMEHIFHSYGEHTVLKDFCMDIQDGEFISVIGGSGSGKTTVLKLINGLLIPDQGEIHVQNKDIRKVDQNELRRNIGYVIQSIGLFPHMTIEENIGYALASHPKILLMDEPFGAVDEITRHSLQDEILRIYHELHITIFFITHDIREALRLGTRVMIMKDGNIEQFDTPDIVNKQPQTEFVRQLLSYLNE